MEITVKEQIEEIRKIMDRQVPGQLVTKTVKGTLVSKVMSLSKKCIEALSELYGTPLETYAASTKEIELFVVEVMRLEADPRTLKAVVGYDFISVKISVMLSAYILVSELMDTELELQRLTVAFSLLLLRLIDPTLNKNK